MMEETVPDATLDHRLWLTSLAVTLLVPPLYYGLGSLGPPGAVVQTIVYQSAGFLAAAAILLGIRLHRPRRAAPWLLIFAAQISLATGDLLWYVVARLGANPFPSVADAAYLAAYPLMLAGIVLLVARWRNGVGWAVLTDAGLVTTGLGLIVWVALADPILRDSHLGALATAVSLAYPIADIVLAAILAALLLSAESPGGAVHLLAAGLAAMLAADTVFALHPAGVAGVGPSDGLYLLEYGFWATAALHPAVARPIRLSIDRDHRIGAARLATLTGAALVPPLVIAAQLYSRAAIDYPVVLGAWLLVCGLALACVVDLIRAQSRALDRRDALERELRETSETLTGILDASPLAVLVVDRDRLVRFWSRAAERLYGWPREAVLGHRPPIVPDDRADVAGRMLDRVFAGEPSVVDTVLQRTRAGRVIPARVYLAAIVGEDGQTWGVIGVNEDLSETQRLEAELFEARKLESVGRLAGGIAHDFNNILTAIVGFTDLSLLEAPGVDVRDNLQGIRASAQRAAGLTQQLLAFSRRQVLQPQVVDANAVLIGLESMLRRLIGEAIDLRIEPSSKPACLLADRTQLEQVILNLALNARDAMPGGGRLTISSVRRPASAPGAERAGDGGHCAGDCVTIAVSDTGVGMDDDTKSHIFEPFFTTKPQGQGTGLGLATTYGIVRQSGGAIECESAPRAGTTFRLHFPASDGPADRSEPAAAAGRRRSGRVLIVEDEPVLRELASRILVGAGFEVVATGDPFEAVSISERPSPPIDLVLSDVVMPGMRGPELARRLTARQPSLRVLLTSGYADEIVESDRLGGAFLAKPFTPATLLRAVDAALAGAA